MSGNIKSFSELKLSFIDELKKYSDMCGDNTHKPSDVLTQLLKVIGIAEDEVENNGSHAAINWYGWNFAVGTNGFPLNVDKGIEYLEMAMGMGSSEALVSLADIYSGAILTVQDEKYRNSDRAIHYYKKASEQGDGYASYRLANCYRDGVCTKKDLPKALQYAEKAKHQGSAYGKYLWGMWLFDGDIVQQDQVEAYELFHEAYQSTKKGDYDDWLTASLLYWMGYATFTGAGIGQNKEEGYDLIQQAALLGDIGAQTWLDDYAHQRHTYDIVKDEMY